MGTPVETNNSNHQEPRTLKMKSFVSLVFLNIALARPDHGGLHHGAHHAVHHQPATVHHAVHHQPATVHHAVHSVEQPMLHHAVHHNAVHHNAVHHHQPVHHIQVAPVVAKVAPKTIGELVVSEPRFSTLLADKEELKAVLLRHVVPSTLEGKNIPPGTTALTTAGGEKISVRRDTNNLIQIQSTAGSAYVVLFDVIASNGVVHAVDSVF